MIEFGLLDLPSIWPRSDATVGSSDRGEELGTPFACVERSAVEVLGDLSSYVVCINDPPWSSFWADHGTSLPAPASVVVAWDMDADHLDGMAEQVAATTDHGGTVVGFGGGTALDTAKFLAWKLARPLIQIPTITSVDAGFTEAVGVRVDGRVRYIGSVVPQFVALDLPLVRSAPKRFNRAGVGDILSCHTGLFDWRLASNAGLGQAWHEGLAALGSRLLDELDEAVDDVAAVSDDGVRFLADAYRRIGAACAWAGHSRFEEGSEHFWAYAYEHATGAHPVHGEIIAFAVCALSQVQGNDADRARRVVERSRVRAHPTDLGIARDDFARCLLGLADYARSEHLDVTIADLRGISAADADAAWAFVSELPRRAEP